MLLGASFMHSFVIPVQYLLGPDCVLSSLPGVLEITVNKLSPLSLYTRGKADKPRVQILKCTNKSPLAISLTLD